MAEEEKTAPEEGMPEEDFTRLLQSVSTMAPLLKSFMPGAGGPSRDKGYDKGHGGGDGSFGGKHHGCARREALLLALKPYLSPARCEAVDYFIRLARVGDAIRALQ